MNAIKKHVLKNKEYRMFFVLIIMLVISAIISPVFRSWENLINLFSQNAVYGIMAIGMTFVILSGCIDLSVSSTVALTGVISAFLFRDCGLIIGILGGLLVGCAIGFINGILITKAKINYLITTLGTMTIVRGAVLIITNGYPVQGIPEEFGIIGMGKILVFPIVAVIWLVLVAIVFFVLKNTKFGHYIYAIGGNEKAAWLSGVKTDRIKILSFLLCGFFASIAGVLLVLKLLIAQADAAQGYEMNVIAACIIGGLSLDGGRGNALNSVFGTLILGLILNMLQLVGVSSFWQQAVTGFIILGAVGLDSFSNIKRD